MGKRPLETKTHYVKETSPGGRVRYIPVDGYQWGDRQQWPQGDHLVHIDGASGSYSYHIKPDCAAIEAAIMSLRLSVAQAMSDASRPRPSKVEMSVKERKCWDAYEAKAKDLGLDPYPPTLIIESAAGIVDAGIALFREKIKAG